MNDNELKPSILLKPIHKRILTLETLMMIIAASSGLVLVVSAVQQSVSIIMMFLAGIVFTLSIVALLRLLIDPDSIRARQTDNMLRLARQTLACMHEGFTPASAQQICELLLPNTVAIAVAISDRHEIQGYAGVTEQPENPVGRPIATTSTLQVIREGKGTVALTPEDIGFPFTPVHTRAAIIVPLRRGRRVTGSLKFYYRSARHISETQKSIAEGFAYLLSTQISAEALEEQTKLATSMELKALQAQINPHFLFNTINTISSLIRTDPMKARTLLREFAAFYRHTLDNSEDLAPLERELEQVRRYFDFEIARFGEERLELLEDVPEGLEVMMMPSFLIQPLVENCVHHGRPAEGKLTICIRARQEGKMFTVDVIDDGVGMDEEARQHILNPESSTGLGIAVRNVNERVQGYFGPGSHMEVESAPGKGTTVRLVMNVESVVNAASTIEVDPSEVTGA